MEMGSYYITKEFKKNFYEITKSKIIKKTVFGKLGICFNICFIIRKKDEEAFKQKYYEKAQIISIDLVHEMYGEECKCSCMYITKEDLKEKYENNIYYAML